jgi:hypothetical protein
VQRVVADGAGSALQLVCFGRQTPACELGLATLPVYCKSVVWGAVSTVCYGRWFVPWYRLQRETRRAELQVADIPVACEWNQKQSLPLQLFLLSADSCCVISA